MFEVGSRLNAKYPPQLAPSDKAIIAAYHLPSLFGLDSFRNENLFFPNERTLIVSLDLKFQVWDLETKELIHIVDHHKKMRCSAITNDRCKLVIGGINPQITIIDIATGNIIQEIHIRSIFDIFPIFFSTTGR